MNIALFASGKGTNVENILHYFKNSKSVNIVFIGTNNPKSGAILHAKNYQIINKLNQENIDLLVLAGFLLKLPSNLIRNFKGKIINIHPSLLPKYGGKGMYGDHIHKKVLKNKEKYTGITFHYVNENYDEGKIISQHSFLISSSETLSTLKEKISQLELLNYPTIISSFKNE